MKRILDTTSTVAVIVASGVLVWKLGFSSPPAQPPARPAMQDVTGMRLDASRLRHVTGSGDVAIVEFTDFQCPFCAKHARETFPELRKQLIDSGKARYVSVNYPLERIHPAALRAAEAAECAGRQGQFWPMHERLFSDGTSIAADRLPDHAKALGLDGLQFDACMKSSDVEAQVRRDEQEGKRLGVQGTPAFFIGVVEHDGSIILKSRIDGALSADAFARAVDEARPGTRSS